MQASKNCIDLIKKFEGFSATAYLCPAGVPTIGYGSTRYADGTRVTLKDPKITEQVATDIIVATLNTEYVPAVNRYVQVPINQNQFDALVSFVYNLGTKSLLNSTLLKKLNAGDFAGAAEEFDKWVMAAGKKLAGLVARRSSEKVLFKKPV